MGKGMRSRISFNRKRLHVRQIIKLKKKVVIPCLVFFVLLFGVSIFFANKLGNNEITTISTANSLDVKEYKELNKLEISKALLNKVDNNDTSEVNKSGADLTLCLTGEIMMGSDVSKNLDYSYLIAFKDIYNITKSADFTYANFSTNITNLKKIEDSKSKYIVTKDAINALTTLGIDAVSIANDHVLDFGDDIVKNTINILEDNDIYVAGRQDSPVYLEKLDKKIAIISTNSVIIGTDTKYIESGISIFDINRLKQNINIAKNQADLVILDVHWGREFTYGVTNQMKTIATLLIDAGADMVLGSHAMGIYPVVMYKDKPIIYSTGYLIGDSNSILSKEGFIFNIKISKDKKIETIEMIPTFVEDKKKVMLYSQFNIDKTREILKLYNGYHLENGLNSKIVDDKIIIQL